MSARGRSQRLSIRDIEKAMGQKADEVGPYRFDPETMSWGRTITFKLRPAKKTAPRKVKRQ